MAYKIRITDDAQHDVRQLPGHVRQRARDAMSALANQPRPPAAKELRGLSGYFRVRLDRWRIIYHVYDDDKVVLILRVRRKTGPDTYSDLK